MRLLFICAVGGFILALIDRDYSEAGWAAWAGIQAIVLSKFIARIPKD